MVHPLRHPRVLALFTSQLGRLRMRSETDLYETVVCHHREIENLIRTLRVVERRLRALELAVRFHQTSAAA